MSSLKGKEMSARRLALRHQLWPTITDHDLWTRNVRKGFATVPRSLPTIAMIMNGMNKGAPVSSVYIDLWCRAPDEMYVTLTSPEGLAFSAGFDGQRGARTWKDRMIRLRDQGFIDIQAGAHGDMSFALIFNPYHAIRRHYEAKHPAVTRKRYQALLARADEIGANDLQDVLPDDWRLRAPPIEPVLAAPPPRNPLWAPIAPVVKS